MTFIGGEIRQNSFVPDDFIHRSGSTAFVFLARARDHLIETACLNILFELLVPERVEMLAQFFCQLPCLFRRQLLDCFANFSNAAHTCQDYLDSETLRKQRSSFPLAAHPSLPGERVLRQVDRF
jgi:hypothetical protein